MRRTKSVRCRHVDVCFIRVYTQLLYDRRKKQASDIVSRCDGKQTRLSSRSAPRPATGEEGRRPLERPQVALLSGSVRETRLTCQLPNCPAYATCTYTRALRVRFLASFAQVPVFRTALAINGLCLPPHAIVHSACSAVYFYVSMLTSRQRSSRVVDACPAISRNGDLRRIVVNVLNAVPLHFLIAVEYVD